MSEEAKTVFVVVNDQGQVLTAKVMGMKARPYFELESPAAAKAPKVDFSTPPKKSP